MSLTGAFKEKEMIRLYYKKLLFYQTENRYFDQSLFKLTVFLLPFI
ncbi:hypothetical protein ABH961_005216 [Bacillus sp. RC251]